MERMVAQNEELEKYDDYKNMYTEFWYQKMEFFNTLFIIFVTIGAGWLAWESTVMVSEKKARYRAGTHDYYDNPIEEEDQKEVK